MYKRANDTYDEEDLQVEELAQPSYRERVKMPVGRHSKARVAKKISWRSSQVSNRYSRARGGFHHRKRKRPLE